MIHFRYIFINIENNFAKYAICETFLFLNNYLIQIFCYIVYSIVLFYCFILFSGIEQINSKSYRNILL